MAAAGFTTLICPRGSEQALVSAGAVGWQPYVDPNNPHRYLVDVPTYYANQFCTEGSGFVALAAEGLLPAGGVGIL